VIGALCCNVLTSENEDERAFLGLARMGKDLPESGTNTVNTTAAAIESCACPLCETVAKSDLEYFARAFEDARRFAATSEAMTDTLGFCLRHGTTLLSQAHLSGGIVHVFRDVIPRMIPLLAEEYIHEDRVQQVFFGASSACPACAYGNRAVSRHAGRLARKFSSARNQAERRWLGSLCIRHFQILAGALKPDIRMAAFRQYVDTLERAARAIKKGLRSRRALDALPLEHGAAALHPALDLTAGRPVPEPCHNGDAIAEVLQRCPTLVEGIAYAEACPVCLEVDRARRRWIHDVPMAAEFRQIGWLFFPTCPEHLWTVVRLGDPKLTAIVVMHALQVAIGHIQQEIAALVRAAEIEAELAQEAAASARSGARPRQKKTEIPKPITVRPTRCPGCERLVIAEDHATDSMLELLQQRKYRNAYHRGYGLCMKHFAQAYLLAPKGAIRTTLAEGQQGRLTAFAQMLDEMLRAAPGHGTTPPEEVPWRTALHRFCGFA
jgi:hypothetical protein